MDESFRSNFLLNECSHPMKRFVHDCRINKSMNRNLNTVLVFGRLLFMTLSLVGSFSIWTLSAQDCLETCECHPLSLGFEVEVADETGCAPFTTSLNHLLTDSAAVGYSFYWQVSGGDFTWTAGTSSASESPTIQFLESGVYQFELTAVDTAGFGCSGTSSVASFVVAGTPEVMISEVPELCAGEEGIVQVLVNPGNTALTAFAWGANETWDTLSVPAPLVQSFENSGFNEVVAWASNSCGTNADTVLVTVYPTPALSVSSSHSWYCLGSYVDFVADGDGVFTWSSNSELIQGGQPSDSTARYTVGSQVTGSVNTTVNHGGKQCYSSAGFNAYGFFVPSVSIAADEVACAGDPVDLQADIASYGWDTSVEWLVDGVPADTSWISTASSSTSTDFIWDGEDLPGFSTVEAVLAFDPYPEWLPNYGCTDTVAHVIEVVPLPSIEAPATWAGCDQLIEEDFPAVLPEGGWWTSVDGTVLDQWVPGAFGLGEHEVIYTYEDSYGCQSFDSILLQVETPVLVSAGADTALCGSTELATLEIAEEGGYWTGPGVTNGYMGVIDIAELAPGQFDLVYHLGEGSCATSDTVVWEILENPTAILSTEGSIACDGDTVWLEAFIGGGAVAASSDYVYAWSSQVEFDSSGSTFFIADASVSLETIELVVTDDAGCTDNAIAVVSPVSLPDAVAPVLEPTCNQNFDTALPSVDGQSGEWSGPGVSQGTNIFNPMEIGEGQIELVYTVTSALGCINSDTALMEVLAPPFISAGPSMSVCANAQSFEMVGFEPAGGTWAGGVGSVEGQGIFDPISSGVGMHALTYSLGEESCLVVDSMTIEVTALPILITSEAQVICAGDTAFGFVAVEGTSDYGSYSFTWDAPFTLGGDAPWELSSGPWSVPGPVSASVVVTDSLGCEVTAELQWDVQELPDIHLPPSWAVCANEGAVELPVVIPDNGVWSGTGVETGLFNSSDTAAGTHVLTYAVVDESGCENEATLPVEIVEPIDFDLGSKIHTCENQGLEYLPTPIDLIGFWEGPGLSPEAPDAVDLNLVSPGEYAYVFTHTGEVCTISSDIELEVHAKPEVSVISSNDVCPDSLLILEVAAVATDLPLQLEWSIDDVAVPGDTTVLSVLWPSAGTHSVLVNAIDDWGCFASLDWSVEVLEQAQVDVGSSLTVCNQAVPIDLSNYAASLEPGSWNYTGIGNAGNAIDSLHHLHPESLDPGSYEVLCEFVPVEGCSTLDTIALIVEVPYQVQAGSDTAVCASNDVIELAVVDGSVDVIWSTINAPITAVLNATMGLIDLSELGVGTHNFMVTAGTGSCVTSDTLIVDVIPAPELDFSGTASSGCVESELLLTVNAINADTVVWNWNDQSVYSDSLFFSATEAGTSEFEVFALDTELGCGSSAFWSVTVYDEPSFDIVSDVDEGCSPLHLTLSVEGFDEDSQWEWLLNGVQVSNEETFDSIFETSGTVSTAIIGLSSVDGNGCSGFTSKEIEVWPVTNSNISLQEEVVCGFPANVQAYSDSNEEVAVYWNVNDELVSMGDTASLPILSLGWHSVEAVITNAWGCSYTATDSIESLTLPSAFLSAEPMMGCGPLEVQLNLAYEAVQPTLSLLHQGSIAALSLEDSILVLDEPGAYQVMLHIIDDYGCENTVILDDSITVFPSPWVDFESNPYAGTFESPDPLNSTWSFDNLSDAGEALWDFGDGTLSTIWDGAHTYEHPGTYAVNVMVVNAYGCEGEASMEIAVEENLQVFVPNAFTPPSNGYSDGVNDGWRPEISAPELVDGYWLRLFNRNGQLIWESHDAEEYWIGQGGQESAFFGMNDTYVWVLQLESRAQRPAQRQWRGHVTLIR